LLEAVSPVLELELRCELE